MANTTVRHRHRPTPGQALEAEVKKSAFLASPKTENTQPPIALPQVAVHGSHQGGTQSGSGNGVARPQAAQPQAAQPQAAHSQAVKPKAAMSTPSMSMPPQSALPPSKSPMQTAGNGARASAMAANTFGGSAHPLQPLPSQQPAVPVTSPANVIRPLADALARAMPPVSPNAPPIASNTLPGNGNVTYPMAPLAVPPSIRGNSTTAPPPLPSHGLPPQLTPDLSNLPPGVAASLARLAGVKMPSATKSEDPPSGGTT